MKAQLQKGGGGGGGRERRDLATPESNALFSALRAFTANGHKRYHIKAVRALKKKKGEEEESYSLQREPTWEHKALSGSDSILYAKCNQSYGKPLKRGAYRHRSE